MQWCHSGYCQISNILHQQLKKKAACLVAESLTHANVVRLPLDGHSLPLTGSAVGNEGLTVAVFMDWTLTHVRHT